jgi:hypothetical protein
MKSKNFKKKLVLNKKTIADLSNGKLGLVKGGQIEPPTLLIEKCPHPTAITCQTQCIYTGYCATCGPECLTDTLDPI